MASNQALQAPTFSGTITSKGFQALINRTLGDEGRAKRFTAGIISAVSVNPQLQNCDAKTIVAAGFLGEALNLSPSPQLGQYYMVPFKNQAQFILGYKGMMQLAQRSGQLLSLDAVEIKRGEVVRCDPIRGVYEFSAIEDPEQREKAETVGFYAYFEMLNGFRKEIYWTRAQMEAHASARSASYGRSSSPWTTNFDDMGRKTVLRQLISKHGCPMSVEMESGVMRDEEVRTVDVSTGEVTVLQDAAVIDMPAPHTDDPAPPEPEAPAGTTGQQVGLDDLS
jgi:recombination protein RecT